MRADPRLRLAETRAQVAKPGLYAVLAHRYCMATLTHRGISALGSEKRRSRRDETAGLSLTRGSSVKMSVDMGRRGAQPIGRGQSHESAWAGCRDAP